MRLIETDVTCSVVCLSVFLRVGYTDVPGKITEPIEIPFWRSDPCGSREPLDGSQDRTNSFAATRGDIKSAMRPFDKILSPLVIRPHCLHASLYWHRYRCRT